MSICYKTFKTPLAYYVYDRHTNKILKITKEDYEKINSKRADDTFWKKFQNKGYLLENRVEEIEHPDTAMLSHTLNEKMEYLLLQVTQECNLRCHYCVYGGNYETRVHSDLNMDISLAEKAIDYYLEHSSQAAELMVGFYGGEPLLKMDLIKHCVSYIKAKATDKVVKFTVTTNGTLLTIERAQYFSENNFHIVISLDGSKEDHDKNRIFRDSGKGTFDVIMRNMQRIRATIPEFLQEISFNTVLNYNCDFSCVKDYYNTNGLVRDSNYMFNLVEESGNDTQEKFSQKFIVEFRYEQFLLFRYMLGKAGRELLSTSQLNNIEYYKEIFALMKDSDSLGRKGHHGGPCIPGGRRLFVSATGEFYPCERVPEEPVMQIGDIEHGIDIKSCERILNVGKVSEEACKNCWALRLCDQCASKCVENGEMSKCKKLCQCTKSKENALDKLMVISMLKEFNYDFEENL